MTLKKADRLIRNVLGLQMNSRAVAVLESAGKMLRAFPLTSRYLIGVSGGRDSVTLLHWLVAMDYRHLIVCHLDHRLRGRSAKADAHFVEKLAEEHGLKFQGGEVDVRELATRKKISIELAGRNARYEFFARVARRERCRTIFLGHHADDFVETFLINLFRGTGPRGLSGMREISSRRIGEVELTIVRPFLSVWRKNIDHYMRQYGLKFREDASNSDRAALRNRIRHDVIPHLEKTIGRDIRAAIWRAATITAEEEGFFDELLPATLTELEVKHLRLMPLTLQRRAVHDWLRAHKISEVNFALVERVRSLVEMTSRVAKTNLPGNRHARRRAGKLFIE
jgi:tRNA(Ile)-lysidine synthase